MSKRKRTTLEDHIIAPNRRRQASGPRSDAVPTAEEERRVLIDAITNAMPEMTAWGTPKLASDRHAVGHGARPLSSEELVDELVERVTPTARVTVAQTDAERAGGPPRPMEEARMMRVQKVVNELFAARSNQAPGVRDEEAEATLEKIVECVERYIAQREDKQHRATLALLMTELSSIYTRVEKKQLDDAAYKNAVHDLLQRTGLLPNDPTLERRVMRNLTPNAEFIKSVELDLPVGNDSMDKKNGPVETAVYTVTVALHTLGIKWPHSRTVLMAARKMTDQDRTTTMTPSAFGTRVGPGEAVAQAAQSAFGDQRGVVLFHKPGRK